MKLIIAGSRTVFPTNEDIAKYLKDFNLSPTEIVCGMAKGADLAGKKYGEDSGILVEPFEPEWDKYGKYRAPRIRNSKMAVRGDVLLLIWDGKSGGSRHMKEAMIALNKPIYEVIVESKENET